MRLNWGALAYPAVAIVSAAAVGVWSWLDRRKASRRVRVPQDGTLPLRDLPPGLPVDGEPLESAEQRQAMVLGFLAEVGPDAAEPTYGKRGHS